MTEKPTTAVAMPQTSEVAGLLAEFADPGALLVAAARVRDAGYRHWDAHSPFPVHGIDRAMGHPSDDSPLVGVGGGNHRRGPRPCCSNGGPMRSIIRS